MERKIIISILCFFIIIEIGISIIVLNISPIKLKKTVFTYQYGSEISSDISYYIDGNQTVLENAVLDLSNLKDEVGEYQAKVIYNNQEYPFEIHIIDTIKPKGKLKKTEWNIIVGESIKASDLLSEVNDASSVDVYFIENDEHEKSKTITYYKSGSYVERIIIEDIYGNTSATFRVIINVGISASYPTIEGVNDVIVPLGNEFDLLEGVSAYDDYDGDITEDIVVAGEIGESVGDYTITYTVKNSKGLITKVTRIISVE